MKHVMIDLETLDTKVSAVFLSLAAVPFDIATGKKGKPFVMNVSLDSALAAGRTISESTLLWWLKQRPEIMVKMFEKPEDIIAVLIRFSDWMKKSKVIYPWGNGARFDLGIIEHAYDQTLLKTPWKFTDERDYRTMVKMFQEIELPPKPKEAHDPLVDCHYQIDCLVHVWQAVKEQSI